MMGMFDQREEAFESAFVQGREFRFRAKARRNKLLGLWAAEKIGASGAAAKAYADELVVTATAKNADEVVVTRVMKDFMSVGVLQSEHEIRRQMDELWERAITEVKAGH
jgi:hypothetical protein